MKNAYSSWELFQPLALTKIISIFLVSLPLLYLGNRHSFSFQHLSTFILPPNPGVPAVGPSSPIPANTSHSKSVPPPLPRYAATLERTGIVDRNGAMTVDFEVSWSAMSDAGDGDSGEPRRAEVGAAKKEAIPAFNSTEIEEYQRRHCLDNKGKALHCLLRPPRGYKIPIDWPQSIRKVWSRNLPDPHLHGVAANGHKNNNNWFSIEDDNLVFTVDGPQSIKRISRYLKQIVKMVPDIEFGQKTRTALDVGGGIGTLAVVLMQHNTSVLSTSSGYVNEGLVQFILERGMPAVVSGFSAYRLPYPSQAFDLVHCSSCGLNWTRNDGILLLEVNRILRAGGYFIIHGERKEPSDAFVSVASGMCWEVVRREGNVCIWWKPPKTNETCSSAGRDPRTLPPLCDVADDPDDVWRVDMKACVTREARNARASDPPERLESIAIDARTSRKELYRAERRYWNEITGGYIRAYRWKSLKLRNVMDMRAGFGGFAAALQNHPGLNCWVMNVVPVSGFNTLPVIYDRGLIGVAHDWCEPFDTYPRTYDLLHASGLFSVERKRCSVASIMLEMDRILRPDGRVYVRDSLDVMEEIRRAATAVGWLHALHDTSEGPHASWKILICEKRMSPI